MMSDSLGLSIGVTNLVAARVGNPPVIRSAVLTLFDHRPSEVGLPEENPNLTEPGLVLRGFIERIGDPTPLVAADGTKYSGEALTVEALEAMARAAGYGTPITIAVPAYWSEGQFRALREEFFAQPGLAAAGVAPALMSDATAALATLYTKPGFPTNGFVALCDFGASGTSVTLLNAGTNFQQVGPSIRNTDFSGDAIDQLILNHLRAGALGAEPAPTNVGGTTQMGSFARLLGECQRAKERLSAATVTAIPTGPNGDIRLSRNEFEQLIAEPLDRFAATIEDVVQRNGIPRANLVAVATVGGGAAIPLLTTRLSERLQAPIFTTPQPAFSAAIGAAILGQQRSASAATAAPPTTAAPATTAVETPTELVETPPTQAAPTALVGDTGKSGAQPPVAWSQDTATGQEPVPYTGPEHTGGYGRETTGFDDGYADSGAAEPGPLPWYKRTALVVSVAAAGAAVLVAVVLALTMHHPKPSPATITPPPETKTITGPNGPTVTVSTPPPTEQPATTTTTTTTEESGTTTTQSSTTTTTQQTTTTNSTTSSQTVAPTSQQTSAPPGPPARRPLDGPFRQR
jgi:hypothetical protein